MRTTLSKEEFNLLSQLPYVPFTELASVKVNHPEINKVIESNSSPILLTSFPKSGSTLVHFILSGILRLSQSVLFYDGIQTDQSLYVPAIIQNFGAETIAQHHIRGTFANIAIINFFCMPTIVCVRNIFDALVSSVDYNERLFTQFKSAGLPEHENWFENFPRGFNGFQMNLDFHELSRSQRIDIAIDTVIPWYFNFYAYWKYYAERGDINIFWINYNDLMDDQFGVIWGCLKYLGFKDDLALEEEKILRRSVTKHSEVVRKKSNRFNKGTKGRGINELTELQIERIYAIASGYIGVNFKEIGL